MAGVSLLFVSGIPPVFCAPLVVVLTLIMSVFVCSIPDVDAVHLLLQQLAIVLTLNYFQAVPWPAQDWDELVGTLRRLFAAMLGEEPPFLSKRNIKRLLKKVKVSMVHDCHS